MARVYAIADPAQVSDSTYVAGIRTAVSVAVDYALAAAERAGGEGTPLPPELLVQARLAARSGVGLDTVLRRYVAGYSLFANVLVEEAEKAGILDAKTLKSLTQGYATLFDRLIVAVTEEYQRQAQQRPSGSERRQVEHVRRLLAGDTLDTSVLPYAFGRSHVAIVACGDASEAAIREIATELDRNLLLVRPEESTIWAWLGGRRPLDPGDLMAYLADRWPARHAAALGEAGTDLTGWRLSHRQARAALHIAQKTGDTLVRYSQVALLATVLKDDVLVAMLRRRYLEPLKGDRDDGETSRRTLRAYFNAAGNASSAAAALGVNRNTVRIRLAAIEERLGRSLAATSVEMETALRLHELEESCVSRQGAHTERTWQHATPPSGFA
jgi:PucR-like helix-turn-helix protein/diguanylate cyclase with GGDEF domain